MTAPVLRHPAPASRRRASEEALVRRVLDAALAVFSERGFAAARIEEIARKAAVSRAALYQQFPSKEMLFREVIRGRTVGILRCAPPREGAASAESELRALATWYWDCVRTQESAALHRLVLEERVRFPDLARLHAQEVVASVVDAVERVIARGIAMGEFSAMDARTTANAIVMVLLGQAVWCANAAQLGLRPCGEDGEMLVRTLNVLLKGILLQDTGRAAAPEA